MRRTIFLFFLVSVIALFAVEVRAQEPVSQSERQVVVKALETKIAELEVRRAMEMPVSNPILIDQQLSSLRKRLAELVGISPNLETKPCTDKNAVGKYQRLLQETDSPLTFPIP